MAYLIAKGENVDSFDRSGITPLMWAASRTMGLVVIAEGAEHWDGLRRIGRGLGEWGVA